MHIISRSRALLATTLTAALLTACTPAQIREVERVAAQQQKPLPVSVIAHPTSDPGTDFLRYAAALHNEAFLVCTRAHESDTAGGYRAFNPQGPYFGAYQYLQHTWNNAAARWAPQYVGWDVRNVPGFWQDTVTWQFYLVAGNGPWAHRC